MAREEVRQDGNADSPGKTRTMWHPLFVRLLEYVLSSGFTVVDEVLVGKMPLRIDVLLVRRTEPPEITRHGLDELLPLLNKFTLLEFKGPTDSLESGDLGQLLGCSYLWQSQQPDPLSSSDISLLVVAPRLTTAFANEISRLGGSLAKISEGIHQLNGLPFTAHAVESDAMALRGQPVLSLVSGVFLNSRDRIMELIAKPDNARIMWYALQQIHQFELLGEVFAMQHAGSEEFSTLHEDAIGALREFLASKEFAHELSVEDRLRGVTAERILRELPIEEILRGLPPEDRLRGLSVDERRELRELLEREASDTDS